VPLNGVGKEARTEESNILKYSTGGYSFDRMRDAWAGKGRYLGNKWGKEQ